MLFRSQTISLRYFNVFGPRQNPEGSYAGLIPGFIKQASEGKTLYINGDGEQTRDFTFVEDVVEANILASKTENEQSYSLEISSIFSLNNLLFLISIISNAP